MLLPIDNNITTNEETIDAFEFKKDCIRFSTITDIYDSSKKYVASYVKKDGDYNSERTIFDIHGNILHKDIEKTLLGGENIKSIDGGAVDGYFYVVIEDDGMSSYNRIFSIKDGWIDVVETFGENQFYADIELYPGGYCSFKQYDKNNQPISIKLVHLPSASVVIEGIKGYGLYWVGKDKFMYPEKNKENNELSRKLMSYDTNTYKLTSTDSIDIPNIGKMKVHPSYKNHPIILLSNYSDDKNIMTGIYNMESGKYFFFPTDSLKRFNDNKELSPLSNFITNTIGCDNLQISYSDNENCSYRTIILNKDLESIYEYEITEDDFYQSRFSNESNFNGKYGIICQRESCLGTDGKNIKDITSEFEKLTKTYYGNKYESFFDHVIHKPNIVFQNEKFFISKQLMAEGSFKTLRFAYPVFSKDFEIVGDLRLMLKDFVSKNGIPDNLNILQIDNNQVLVTSANYGPQNFSIKIDLNKIFKETKLESNGFYELEGKLYTFLENGWVEKSINPITHPFITVKDFKEHSKEVKEISGGQLEIDGKSYKRRLLKI